MIIDPLTDQQHRIALAAPRALDAGRQLKQWLGARCEDNSFFNQFELLRSFNRPDSSFGFFDTAVVGKASSPVLGEVEDRLFDRAKSKGLERYRDVLREFVLRYLLRVSDIGHPVASAGARPQKSQGIAKQISWCDDESPVRDGFGYTQVLYKLRSNGTVGAFPPSRRFQITDLRELTKTYEWIILRVRIFDFSISVNPFGNENPGIAVPLNESSFIVLSSDFLDDQNEPETDSDGRTIVGRYGFGYAFIKGPEEVLGYGPGQFDVAFQEITFRIYEDGETRVKLAFVANRPKQIMNVPIAPFSWGVSLANAVTLGIAAPLIDFIQPTLSRFPFRLGTFDPVSIGVDLANLSTGNQAARKLCISREQLEKTFLVKHFDQHYQMLNGALQTWREIPDWTDEASLPDWVKTGVSS